VFYLKRGKSYFLDKQYEKAISDFKHVNEKEESPKINFELGLCYSKLNPKGEESENYFKKALKLNPTDIKMLVNIGWNYYKIGEFKKCIEYNKKAIKIDANNTMAGFNIAISYLRLNQIELSYNSYKKYAKISMDTGSKFKGGAIKDLNKLKNEEISTKEVDHIINNILN